METDGQYNQSLYRGYSLERQLKQPFGEMSTSIFNQFTFMSAGPEQMSSFYGLNKCVQYAIASLSLIEIPAATALLFKLYRLLLKASSNDMGIIMLAEP